MWNRATTHFLVLYVTAILLRAKKVVELGTGTGCSGEVLSDALKVTEGMLYSVDKFPEGDTVKEGKRMLAGRNNITFVDGDSIEVGRDWKEGEVDMVFCDSDHAKEHVLSELRVWGSKAKVLLVHDIFTDSGELNQPYLACEEYAEESERQFIPIGSSTSPHGIGILI